jgi:hypothetical protein
MRFGLEREVHDGVSTTVADDLEDSSFVAADSPRIDSDSCMIF